jgi:large subunit ribosomal protein L31
MKSGVHPDYHMINVEMTDGTKFQVRSTWGKEGDTLHLEIDPKVHPPWTGGSRQVLEGCHVARVNKSFGGLCHGKKELLFRAAPRIETDRLILRAFGAGDLDAHAARLGEDEIMRHIGGKPVGRED